MRALRNSCLTYISSRFGILVSLIMIAIPIELAEFSSDYQLIRSGWKCWNVKKWQHSGTSKCIEWNLLIEIYFQYRCVAEQRLCHIPCGLEIWQVLSRKTTRSIYECAWFAVHLLRICLNECESKVFVQFCYWLPWK